MDEVFKRSLTMTLSRHRPKPDPDLSHPNDFAATVEIFVRLIDAGHSAGQDQIYEFLTKSCNFGDDDALSIQRIYETVAQVKQPQGGPWWKDDVIAQVETEIGKGS